LAATDVPRAPSTQWSDLGAVGTNADPARVPVRIRVHALGIDAPVSSSAVDADGALELPADTTSVAWFAGGPAPGANGSAVLAAHVDHDGQRGVFFSLRDLTPGDAMVITTADGKDQRFVVDAAPQDIRKTALPTAVVFRRTGPAVVTLVTCGGRFDRTARSYEDNTIVTARAA
jgi:hypothetical protein